MANLQFWRSREMSDTSFLDLIKRTFGKTFTTGLEAKDWLITNGYYTSYPDIVTDGLVLSLDASNYSSFKGEPTSNLLNTDFGLDCTFENRSFTNWVFYDGGPVGGNAEFYIRGSYQGSTSVKLTNSTGSHIAFGGKTWSVVPGDNLTVSLYAKNIDIPSLQYFLMRGTLSGDHTTSFSSTSEWVRYSYSYTATMTEDITIWVRAVENAFQGSFLIDCYQVERKPYVTHFVNGTRGTSFATGGGWCDLSGNGNHGELVNGPTYSGENGGCVVFDYVNDYIGNFVDCSLGSPTTFTLSAWINSTNIALPQNIINANGPFFLRITNSKIRCNVYTGTWIFVEGSITLSSNTWYNLVLTYDQSAVKGYINSVLDVNSPKTGIPQFGCLNTIGYTVGGEDAPSVSKISTIQIYNKALSPTEITQNFNATKERFGL